MHPTIILTASNNYNFRIVNIIIANHLWREGGRETERGREVMREGGRMRDGRREGE